MVGWDDGPQQEALDFGWQHALRSVLSQQASAGIGPGLGVEDVAAMSISFCNGRAQTSRWLDGFDQGGGHDTIAASARVPVLDEFPALRLYGDAHLLEPSVGDHPLELRHGCRARDTARRVC